MRYLRPLPILLAVLAFGVTFGTPLVANAALSLSGMLIDVAGFFLWIGASLFNAAVNLFVLNMGGLITGENWTGIALGQSIDATWKIVRDLVNLTFIFGLIYVGFRTILDAGTDTKKLLASILVGALLVNFSLFISKLVIDVSNLTAIEIYQQMGISDTGSGAATKSLDIADRFLARMGIVQLVTLPNVGSALSTKSSGQNIDDVDGWLSFVIGSMLFILIATFVFAAGAILLAIRFGILIFLMILSPIAFAAAVFPALSGWSKKWWSMLFSQAFFAPAYLFLLYLTLVVADGYQQQMRGFDKIFSNERGVFEQGFITVAFFATTIVMMVASLIIAKQMGAYGAGKALALGNAARRAGQGYFLRNTAGRAARGALSGYESLDARISGSKFAQSKWGGRSLTFARGLTNVATLGATSDKTIRRGLKAGAEAKYGGYSSLADDEKYDKEVTATRSREQRAQARARVGAAYKNIKNDRTADPAAREDAQTKWRSEVQKMTLAELAALPESSLEENAQFLTNKQMDQIADSKAGEFTDTQIAKLKQLRKEHFANTFNAAATEVRTNPAAVRDYFKGMKDEDIAKLGKDILTRPETLEVLSAGVLRKGADQNIFSREDMEAIRSAINAIPPAQLSSSINAYKGTTHYDTYFS